MAALAGAKGAETSVFATVTATTTKPTQLVGGSLTMASSTTCIKAFATMVDWGHDMRVAAVESVGNLGIERAMGRNVEAHYQLVPKLVDKTHTTARPFTQSRHD